MIDAVKGLLIAFGALGTGEIGEMARVCPSHLPLLRITLEDMLPWILLWIAIAGVTRLFTGPGPDDRGTSSYEDDEDD